MEKKAINVSYYISEKLHFLSLHFSLTPKQLHNFLL